MSKYSVQLTQEQRKQLKALVKVGKASARQILHAHILLQTDSGTDGPRWPLKRIQESLGVGSTVVKTVRKRFVEEGLEAALNRRKQPARPQKRKITGEQEARIIAVQCTEKPTGQERWTLRTLTDRIIELEIVEQVSDETVRTVLKKTNSNRGKRSNGV